MIGDWQPVSLGEFVAIKHGFAFKGEHITDKETNNFLLSPGNFAIGGGFQWGKRKYYAGPVTAEYILQPDDIIVTMTDLSKDADTLGYAARIPSSEKRLLHNQRLGKLIFGSEKLKPSFAHWLLRTTEYRNEILANYTGSTVKHTSPAKICAFEFLLPSEEEQVAIARLLDLLDDKIELNRRMSATLEEMARALYRSWFVDFDPVHARARGDAPAHMDPATAALFPDRFGEDGLPEGWRSGEIRDLADLTPEKWSKRNAPNEIDYVDLANTKWGEIESTSSYKWPEAPSRARLVLRPGDTIIGTVRPGNGSYSYISRDGLTASTGFAVLRPQLRRDRAFIYCTSTAGEAIEALTNLADGAAYPAIRPEVVAASEVVVPHDAPLSTFDELAQPMLGRISAAQNENQTLATLRDALLPKLMSGELRIRDAEALVGEVA